MATFTILTVCTGNVCRSPLAEQLLRLELQDLPGVRVHSVGTRAVVGAPMSPPSQHIAASLGVLHPETHVGRQLTVNEVRDADLILAMSREHRRATVELLPRASRVTFTVREFARLANTIDAGVFETRTPLMTESPADLMRDGVEVVASLRGSLPPLDDPRVDDVVDPYGQTDEIYAQSAAQLVPAVRATGLLLRRAAIGAI